MSGSEVERPPSGGPSGAPPAPPGDQPSDDDRRRVIDLLRGASSRLGLDESERRMDAALRAPTKGELALLVWDLPDAARATPPDTAQPKVRAWTDFAFRLHSTAYALTNGMLVGIWAITDSHDIFWPFFPIAGWGIGLGAHGVVARAMQRRRYQREIRRLERAAAGELPRRGPTGLPAAPTRNQSHRPPAGHRSGARPAGPEPHRPRSARVVVMFADVVDSTRLTMVIGDEDWTRVRHRYRQMLHDCFALTNGQEVGSQGDGFLARFDRAADAVRCAIAFQRKLGDQRHEVGFAPAVRIGINAGDAIEDQGDVLGTTVNLAARITAAAEPNEILVTETVADQLDGSFEIKDQGLRELKGLGRTAHVLSVGWR